MAQTQEWQLEIKAACLKAYETIYNMIFIQIWYASQNQAYQAEGISGLNYVWKPKRKNNA